MNSDLLNDEFYNANADRFDKIPFESILIPLILKYFPKSGCHILEIGPGGGALALWMTNQGQAVTCIEPAEKLAEKTRAKGLKVYQKRFQDFTISQKFDGLIAISSLIHIPRAEMPLQIEKMSQLLKTEGVAIVSFIEGDREGVEDPTEVGMQRFFSKFTQSELKIVLSSHFSILESRKIASKSMGQSFILLVLKQS